MITRQSLVAEKNSIISDTLSSQPLYYEPAATATATATVEKPASSSTSFPGFLEESPSLRFRTRAVAIVAGLVGLTYLTWRALDTLNLSVWWISLPLFLVEIQAFISLFLFTFSLWDVNYLKTPPKVTQFKGRVAVLIPTYNEGIEVLLPTVTAALGLQLPHETWILDDGDRPEVKDLAHTLGAYYLTRPDHSHAKAGNINHALEYIEADFIAIFDADHVASPDFLTNTLGYFDDPQVALVQTPQDFYNHESFEHIIDRSKKTSEKQTPLNQRYHEQALFYRVIQAGKNRWNAAFWCGTNAVIRLAPLKEIGGLATETITEDIHTTIRFHRRGWKTVFHNEVLARGLAAATASQYQLQRHRWGTGAMQVLRHENPLFVSGLTLPQRLAYAATLLGWFDSWRTLFYLVIPPIVLLTGVVPLQANPIVFLFAFLVNNLFQQWAMVLLGRGMHRVISGTIFELVRMTPNLLATLTLFKKGPQHFKVTPKGRTGQQRQQMPPPRLLVWILAASCLGALVFLMRLTGFVLGHYNEVWVAYGALFWLVFNGWLVWLAVCRVKSMRYGSEMRRSVRFTTHFRAKINGLDCKVIDISLNGVRLVFPDRLPAFEPTGFELGQAHKVTIELGALPITLKVTLQKLTIEPMSGTLSLGCNFDEGQFWGRALLSRVIFTSNSPR